ncbi:MAG: patatin-like phospholipase family protein [Gammaproteobacteria bacterium]
MIRRLLPLCWLAALWLPFPADADPCTGDVARALVLGSGGSRGAFEVGAIYHVVVHRGCDFAEVSGTSIGALNAALLAQAARSDDRSRSLANMQAATENLVAQWESIRDSREVMRARPLGKARVALFGLDSLMDFEPLHDFVRSRVALDALAAGRELRVGTLTLDDGRYREIAINRNGAVDAATAHDFIFASAVVPVFGRTQLLTPPGADAPMQIGDGGFRHAVPVTSYFQHCTSHTDGSAAECTPLTGADTPPHPQIEQLFVVVTSPYEPNTERTRSNAGGAPLADGRRMLATLGSLLVDRLHRDDLDHMLLYNDLLAWQSRTHDGAAAPVFPLGSFNRNATKGRDQPYEIAVISPKRPNSDPLSIFDVDATKQRQQMYCGCMAADEVMQTQFGLASLGASCATRFPAVKATARRAETVALTPAICRDDAAQ